MNFDFALLLLLPVVCASRKHEARAKRCWTSSCKEMMEKETFGKKIVALLEHVEST